MARPIGSCKLQPLVLLAAAQREVTMDMSLSIRQVFDALLILTRAIMHLEETK